MEMNAEKDAYYDCSFVSIHYIICECGETFPSETGLKAHLEKEHPHKRERKEFKCGVCGLTFDSEDDCITHYEENHIAEVKQEEFSDEETDFKSHTVEVTTELSESGQEVAQEETLMEENYVEEDYVEENYEEVSYEQHDENYEQQDYEEQLLAEQSLVQEISGERTLHIPEQFGSMVQVNKDGQLVVIVRKPPKKQSTNVAGQVKQRKRVVKHIVCEVCGKKYASNAALKYHQRVHTGERPYKCTMCPKSFTMPLFLQIHTRTHTGERPYQCPECPKAFSNKAALLRHDRVHTGIKPYACPMCQKTFTQSNSMKLHVTTVHLKQPAPYKSKSRKLKAAERARKPPAVEYENVRIKLDPDEQQPSDDGDSMYEVIESEEVLDEGECYEVVYNEAE